MPKRSILTHIAFPPKINRCCTGGIPAFSSTLSLTFEIWLSAHGSAGLAHLPLRLDVDLDLEMLAALTRVGQ